MQIPRGGKGLKVRSRPLCTTSLLTEEGSLVSFLRVSKRVGGEIYEEYPRGIPIAKKQSYFAAEACTTCANHKVGEKRTLGRSRPFALPSLHACRRLHPWRLRHPRGELRLAPSGGGARGVCGDDDQRKHIPGRLDETPPRREGCLGRQEHRTRTRGKL